MDVSRNLPRWMHWPHESQSRYDRCIPGAVNVQAVLPRKLAAVRREVAPGEVGSAWGPAVGQVWDFIRNQPGLWTDGHNIFMYHTSKEPGGRMGGSRRGRFGTSMEIRHLVPPTPRPPSCTSSSK